MDGFQLFLSLWWHEVVFCEITCCQCDWIGQYCLSQQVLRINPEVSRVCCNQDWLLWKPAVAHPISLQMTTAFDSIEKSNLSLKPQMLPSQYFTFKDIGRINDHMELNVDLSNMLLRLLLCCKGWNGGCGSQF